MTLNASLFGGVPTFSNFSVKSDDTPTMLETAYQIVFENAASQPVNVVNNKFNKPKIRTHGIIVAMAAVPTFEGLLHICLAKYIFKIN